MNDIVVAILIALVIGYLNIIVFIRRMKKREIEEERREKEQEKKLRLLDMLSLYGFRLFLRYENGDIGKPELTGAGDTKDILRATVFCGRDSGERLEFEIVYDPTFSRVMSDTEREEHLREFMFYLERSRDWATGPWMTVHFDAKTMGRFCINLRTKDDLPRGGGLLI